MDIYIKLIFLYKILRVTWCIYVQVYSSYSLFKFLNCIFEVESFIVKENRGKKIRAILVRET